MEENNELSNAFDKLGEMLGTEDGQKQISDIISMLSGGAGEEEISETENEPEKATDTTGNILSGLSGILNSASLPDISSLSGLFSSFGGNSSQNGSTTDENTNMPDMEMLEKAQKLMSAFSMGKNKNPNSAFLQALKPFLRSERRQKVDSAIKILSFAAVFKEFGGVLNTKGGE